VQVPEDHRCPPYHEIMDRPDNYLTCWGCDLEYRREQGNPILPGHPALA
jgi:hypothetical protein